MKYTFLQNGDGALTVQFQKEISKEVNASVTALASLVQDEGIEGVVELIPTFTSLTVLYDCTVIKSKNFRKSSTPLFQKSPSAANQP